MLTAILEQKRQEIEDTLGGIPFPMLYQQAQDSLEYDPPRSLSQAVRRCPAPLAVIAECKRRSPSRGALNLQLQASRQAGEYARGGAAAISVLTESRFFSGSLEDLKEVRQAIKLPLLQKDFILSPKQICQARLAGADAILLIAAALTPQQVQDYQNLAQDLGMEAVVEVHSVAELEQVRPLKPRILAVNNRNLKDFHTSLSPSLALAPFLPARAVKIAASGIRSRDEARRLAEAGYSALLVGEALVTHPYPRRLIPELALASPPTPLPALKICGVTRPEDSQLAFPAGAQAVGVILVEGSPRRVTPDQTRRIAASLPPEVSLIGVLADHPLEEALQLARSIPFSGLQLHGSENPDYCLQLGQALAGEDQPAAHAFSPWPRLVKSLRIKDLSSLETARSYQSVVDAVLLDTYHPQLAGGTGRTFDWTLAQEFKKMFPGLPLILAGGITPGNLGPALDQVGPWGIDLSSGVEKSPGIKDPQKLQALAAALAFHRNQERK